MNITAGVAKVSKNRKGDLSMAMMDSGCSSNVVPLALAHLWGQVQPCSGTCKTASGEMLNIGGIVSMPHGLPGEAVAVDGVTHPLLSVRDFTQSGVNIWFPAQGSGLPFAMYGYVDSGKIVLVADADYMVNLENNAEVCRDLDPIIPPIIQCNKVEVDSINPDAEVAALDRA